MPAGVVAAAGNIATEARRRLQVALGRPSAFVSLSEWNDLYAADRDAVVGLVRRALGPESPGPIQVPDPGVSG